jgi:hypothetical protein
MARPVLPDNVELPQMPGHDGPLVELSFGKLSDNLQWLFQSVELLSKGLKQVNAHLHANADLWDRLETLENKPEALPQVIREEAPQVKVEIPYIPSKEDIAGIAGEVVSNNVDPRFQDMLDKLSGLTEWLKSVEALAGKEQEIANPLERMQVYFQEIGFLPYGEPDEADPLKLLGQVFVLLRQDIAMCPKIKDLEDAENSLKARISEVEAEAAADREARSKVAAAESAKIREDLEKVEKLVQGLIEKNLRDGDVAGGLRDLTLRVDKIEDILRRKEEQKVVVEEEPPKPRDKGFLEQLAEVDLAEEVRRLRSMVECMEAAMPYETRQTLEYLRSGDMSGATSSDAAKPDMTRVPAHVSDLDPSRGVEIRQEIEQLLERFRQANNRDMQNMMKVMKNHERSIEDMDAKLLDLWRRLPKVLALLEPLQAQMEMANSDAGMIDSTGGTKIGEFGPSNILSQLPGEGNKTSEVPAVANFTRTIAALGVEDPNMGKSENEQAKHSLPALQPPFGKSKSQDTKFQETKSQELSQAARKAQEFNVSFKGSFGPPPGLPLKENQMGSPLKEMGSLTGLIKLALQQTTDGIHADLREELLRLRAEFIKALDLKANKTDLALLLNRLDALKKGDKFDVMFRKRDRSLSPSPEKADTKRDVQGDAKGDIPHSPGKPLTVPISPNIADRKKGHTCHERCKEPTCPAAYKMTQSLSRLPALKTVQ